MPHERRRKRIRGRRLHGLPDDVLFMILSFCDVKSLGRFATVCRRFAVIVGHDCVWTKIRNSLTTVRSQSNGLSTHYNYNNFDQLSTTVKEECRLAHRWSTKKYSETKLVQHKLKQLPWMQLHGDELWASQDNRIDCHLLEETKCISKNPAACKSIQLARPTDVTRFVCQAGYLAAATRGGELCVVNTDNNNTVWQRVGCHDSDIHCVDLSLYSSILLSGSRDMTAKLWRMGSRDSDPVLTIPTQDRVWSAAFDTEAGSFVLGTAGLHGSSPLQLWNTEMGVHLGTLGSGYKRGAGVLDIQFDTPSTFLSCGYDTYIRFWDLRASYQRWVCQWEEPFDSTIYCVKSDGHQSFVAGTALHGMLRLWDKRVTRPVQLFYVGKQARSPVYSVAFTSHRLYAALDRGIHMLDFS